MSACSYYRLDPSIRMVIEYSEGAKPREARRITVHGVVCYESVVALEAWCSLHRARRVFDVRRISRVIDVGGFERSPDELVATLADRISHGRLVPVNLPAKVPRQVLRDLGRQVASAAT